ncbi:MAG: phosphoenolpyruvate carboxylase, partial [Chlorobiales bacterium]|nr:phosphoenolpyruvate carboxylase [Chlorobiales bacterium]
ADFDGIYLNEINRIINSVKIFKFHFASIDIRQDSRVLHKVFEELLSINGEPIDFQNLDHSEKEQFLIQFDKKFAKTADGIKLDTIETINTIKEIQELNGEESIHRFIISNCNSDIDVLVLYRLFTASLWGEKELTVDIVPLFETIEALSNCKAVIEKLFTNPVYSAHLKRRKNKQYVMLGFSDGTKDGGYFTANWSIYKAKEMLSEVSAKFGIDIVFFDGRGGPAARGGGKTHEFYASNSYLISTNEIQTTIQGQTVSSNFGTKISATYNIEQLLSARIKNELNPDYHADFKPDHRKTMNEISALSNSHYLKLKKSKHFLGYFSKYTPINYFGNTNIGSRPDKRNQSEGLKLDDLRAIPFVGSWSMNKQNIPGYFGFGESLRNIVEKEGISCLKDL